MVEQFKQVYITVLCHSLYQKIRITSCHHILLFGEYLTAATISKCCARKHRSLLRLRFYHSLVATFFFCISHACTVTYCVFTAPYAKPIISSGFTMQFREPSCSPLNTAATLFLQLQALHGTLRSCCSSATSNFLLSLPNWSQPCAYCSSRNRFNLLPHAPFRENLAVLPLFTQHVFYFCLKRASPQALAVAPLSHGNLFFLGFTLLSRALRGLLSSRHRFSFVLHAFFPGFAFFVCV